MLHAWSFVLLGAVIGIASLHVRRLDNRELEEQKRLVSLYGKMLSTHAAMYEYVDWDTTLVIDERGGAQERLHVRARAMSSEQRFVRLVFGCGWKQPARFRKQVQLSVRNILVDGTPGTSLSQTIMWLDNGTMVVMIHFPEPLAKGKDVTLAIDLVWPGRCGPLIKGVPDEYRVKFSEPARHVRYRIVMPPGASTYSEPIGSEKCPDRYQLVIAKTHDDRELVIFEAFDLPPMHRVGVRLELKDKTAQDIPASTLSPT